MPLHWKLVIDCADPISQTAFWAEALGYVREDNSTLIDHLLATGALPAEAVTEVDGRSAFRALAAIRHPDDPFDPATGTGLGRRLLFQAVPEPKQVKNRLHLDLHAPAGTRDAEVDRLTALGATVLHHVKEPGTDHLVLADPEGNEFCVQ